MALRPRQRCQGTAPCVRPLARRKGCAPTGHRGRHRARFPCGTDPLSLPGTQGTAHMSRGPGSWNGRHYTEYVETVKILKREGRLNEALTLLEHLVDATEQEADAMNWGVAPWYYE